MEIHQDKHVAASRKGAENFTGDVYLDVVGQEPAGEANIYRVLFNPGARTYWHRHTKGQFLLVNAGEGRVQARGGEVKAIKAGDVVHAAPGEEHWHGATDSTYMVHTAVSLGATEWLEEARDV